MIEKEHIPKPIYDKFKSYHNSNRLTVVFIILILFVFFLLKAQYLPSKIYPLILILCLLSLIYTYHIRYKINLLTKSSGYMFNNEAANFFTKSFSREMIMSKEINPEKFEKYLMYNSIILKYCLIIKKDNKYILNLNFFSVSLTILILLYTILLTYNLLI